MKMRIFYKICAVILKVFGVFIPYCFGYYTTLGQTTTFYAILIGFLDICVFDLANYSENKSTKC